MNPNDYADIARLFIEQGMGPYAVADLLNTAFHIERPKALTIALTANAEYAAKDDLL